MDHIRPIGPVERDVDPVRRVERAKDEDAERRERRERPKRSQAADRGSQGEGADVAAGPVKGDDGHMHVDVRA